MGRALTQYLCRVEGAVGLALPSHSKDVGEVPLADEELPVVEVVEAFVPAVLGTQHWAVVSEVVGRSRASAEKEASAPEAPKAAVVAALAFLAALAPVPRIRQGPSVFQTGVSRKGRAAALRKAEYLRRLMMCSVVRRTDDLL